MFKGDLGRVVGYILDILDRGLLCTLTFGFGRWGISSAVSEGLCYAYLADSFKCTESRRKVIADGEWEECGRK
jgi:hypothetical protein